MESVRAKLRLREDQAAQMQETVQQLQTTIVGLREEVEETRGAAGLHAERIGHLEEEVSRH